jgi:Surface-adhesin protein E
LKTVSENNLLSKWLEYNQLARELGREYENVKEIVPMREMDCSGKKSHILGSIYFSDDGRVIKRESYEPIGWDSITPDSGDDVLCHAVFKCLKSAPTWN